MKVSRGLLLTAFAVSLAFFGCAGSIKRSFAPIEKKGWGEYERCLGAGYFQIHEGIQITVFMAASSENNGLDLHPNLIWAFHAPGNLKLDFLDESPNIEFKLYPTQVSIKKSIYFLVKQRMNKTHPEIPKGMTTEYDFKQDVMLYGTKKNLWWGLGPEVFEAQGKLKSPRFLSRTESSQKIDGTPSVGYERDEMSAIYDLIEAGGTVLPFDFIEVILPSYHLNGQLIPSETFRFKYSDHRSAHDSQGCVYWHSRFPNPISVFFYRISPWSD